MMGSPHVYAKFAKRKKRGGGVGGEIGFNIFITLSVPLISENNAK
jgi:hypothetical protein